MSYTKQNFKDGQVLTAECLNCIEDCLVDIEEKVSECLESGIVNSADGEVIVATDASDRELKGMKLYGKTTQNGTPTPDAPVELETVGADGSLDVTVCGKNLLPNTATTQTVNGVTFTVNADGSVTANGTASANASKFTINLDEPLQAMDYIMTGCPVGGTANTYLLTAYDGKYYYEDVGNGRNLSNISVKQVDIWIRPGVTVSNLRFYPMIRLASVTDSTYEPYKGQTLTAQTPNGLPGIPVSSGGNYIDENGQMWVCDEIDFARGKYVKRIGTKTFKGTEAFTQISSNTNCWRVVVPEMWTETAGGSDYNTILALSCSHFKPVRYTGASQAVDKTVTFYSTGEHIIRFTHNGKSVPEYMAEQYAAGNPVKVLYKLAVPTETNLTAEELAQYSTLHTNYPTTTIYNEGAGMSVDYVADTKLYIDKKFTELATALVNN